VSTSHISSFSPAETWGVTYLECAIPGDHLLGGFVSEHALDVVDDVSRVVVGHERAPAGTDAFATIHQGERDDGHIELGFHRQAVVLEVVEELVVVGMEDRSSNLTEPRVEIPAQ
jgi:hypothetical protein